MNDARRRNDAILGIEGEQFEDWEYRLGDWPDGSGPRWISNPVHTAVEEAIKAEAIRPYVEAIQEWAAAHAAHASAIVRDEAGEPSRQQAQARHAVAQDRLRELIQE